LGAAIARNGKPEEAPPPRTAGEGGKRPKIHYKRCNEAEISHHAAHIAERLAEASDGPCPFCHKVYAYTGWLARHLRKHHGPELVRRGKPGGRHLPEAPAARSELAESLVADDASATKDQPFTMRLATSAEVHPAGEPLTTKDR
jgi:uncharacterized C2H2 Zn-finger protein